MGIDALVPLLPFAAFAIVRKWYLKRKHRTPVERLLKGKTRI